jgi:HlyD family secretion protein
VDGSSTSPARVATDDELARAIATIVRSATHRSQADVSQPLIARCSDSVRAISRSAPTRDGVPASLGRGFAALAMAVALFSCKPTDSDRLQGYIEGEFVYVASPRSGSLAKLEVAKGGQVNVGDPLFVLDEMPEQAKRDEAQEDLKRAISDWEDAKKGKRPPEIESATAALEQARAEVALSEKEAARQVKLQGVAGATTEQEVERALAARDRDRQRVVELAADLETARLGSRVDQIAAAEAEVNSARAALSQAEWDLAQKRQSATVAGVVFDTLYRAGDWVEAGRPVVMLLPPANVKLRTFVAEGRVGSLRLGDRLEVHVDGVSSAFTGTISYIAPRAEYTPPVVYSRENRNKFVFLVEAVFAPEAAAMLHPGQPVEVDLASHGP